MQKIKQKGNGEAEEELRVISIARRRPYKTHIMNRKAEEKNTQERTQEQQG